MATFEQTARRRDALMIKRLGELGSFTPKGGVLVPDIYFIVEEGVRVDSGFEERIAIGTVITVFKDHIGKAVKGDVFERGQRQWRVIKPLEDDGSVMSLVVT